MIDVKDKTKCCGCDACVQKCPKQCISMREDFEGFMYPVVDLKNCIDCGLCNMVCPMENNVNDITPIEVFAAYNNNEDERMQSSSGGIFSLLAKKTINTDGVVFGARFNLDWNVILDYADTSEGVIAFRGSKYVQAEVNGAYQKCEQFLKEGRTVLFSGTPCHIAALKRFLHKEYENLLMVDVVCHGAPSPMIWKKYLQELMRDVAHSSVLPDNVQFRNKIEGWKRFHFYADFAGTLVCEESCNNAYMKAFISDLILRPSCYSCPFRGTHRHQSDLSIADFWGVDKIMPKVDDDKGISLVMANTKKGLDAYHQIDVTSCKVDLKEAVPWNGGLMDKLNYNRRRDRFFSKVKHSRNVIKQINIYTLPDLQYKEKTTPIWRKIMRKVKKLVYKKK